jgi:3',5'-cyclic AMP phosphodiesterase CpdA
MKKPLLLIAAYAAFTLTACVAAQPDYDLRFGVISDVHVGSKERGAAAYPNADRLRKALKWYGNQNGVEALAIVGDITDNGSPAQWDEFIATWNAHKGNLRLIAVMGNHDAYASAGKQDFSAANTFETKTGQKVNAHYVLKGYHFIVINGGREGYIERANTENPLTPGERNNTTDENNPFYAAIKDWTIAEIEKAVAAAPNKPVFLLLHHPLKNTFYAADEWYTATFGDGETGILNKYPQVVAFGGHIHTPNNDPRSIWQGGYTAVNTATLHYVEMELTAAAGRGTAQYLGDSHDGITTNAYPKHPVVRTAATSNDQYVGTYKCGPRAQGMIVSVKGSVVTIDNYDFDVSTGPTENVEKIPQQWTFDIAQPANFPYTNALRERQKTAPIFDAAAATDAAIVNKIKIDSVGDSSVTITFEQATIPPPNLGNEVVHSYRFEFYNITDGGILQTTRYQWSDFMNTPRLQKPVYTQILGGLSAGKKYELRIYACGSFQKWSTQYLSLRFEK